MENKGLLFIPDISGFTQFVNQTEIEHSRVIIQELLELLINANQLGLEVSEVEGDAILFYKFGESPRLEDIYEQVKKMFCEFHKTLIAYDHHKFCQCGACISAVGLSLKVITHYGEFTGYNVKNFNKLIGKDIIVAHQLLKNDIEQHEYWLVTQNLLHDKAPAGLTQWMQWNHSSKQTETGEIPFHYTQLSKLKEELEHEPLSALELSQKTKVISVSREYDTDIITLFHAAGDFNFRDQWDVDVKKVEGIGHFLPRVGMSCRCITEKGESLIYASSYSFSPERIEFSETDKGRKTSRYYLLEALGKKRSKLTLDLYLKKNMFSEFLFRALKKKKEEQSMQRSLRNIDEVIKQIHLPPQD